MIKFFRKIRQQLLTENKISKYLLYAIGEILLVMIGILLALQVNNLNENRKKRTLEIQILKELKQGFETDLTDIQSNLKLYNSSQESISIIIDYFKNGEPYHDTLSHNFAQAAAPVLFVSDDTGYEFMKTIGASTISNNYLRKEIVRIHDISYENIKSWENVGMFLDHQYRANQFLKHFDKIEGWIVDSTGNWVPGRMVPRDYGSLRQDQEFMATLRTISTSIDALKLIEYDSIETRLVNVIKSISDEIILLES